MEKIGLAVITYNRIGYLKLVIDRLYQLNWGGANERIIIVDEPFDSEKYSWLKEYGDLMVEFNPNSGVASAKNRGIKHLIGTGCKYIFTLEDDILFKTKDVCFKYIDYAIAKNVPHLNFALHGNLNIGKSKTLTWDRGNSHSNEIVVYPDCVGAFSFYTDDIIRNVGLMDENFKNAWEHVEHTWRIAQTGEIPPFWYFMDHPESAFLLEEICGSLEHSVIRNDSSWSDCVSNGYEYWLHKHGVFLPARPAWD